MTQDNEQKNPKTGFWRTFLIILGILAALVVIMIVGIIIALKNIKPFGIDVTKLPAAIMQSNSEQTTSTYDHPLLSTEQENMLNTLGVDVSTLPTEITPQQIECATNALGQARITEIQAGASVGISDILKAQNCL